MNGDTDEAVPAAVSALMAGRHWTPAEREALRKEVLRRTCDRRRELLSNALTIDQVAELLGESNEDVHDLVQNGTILAVMDDSMLRFPVWQFDSSGEEGVVTGLPAVIRALEVTQIAKANWLTRANSMLEGATPLEHLKAGEVDRVVRLAWAVGVW